eukprot:3518703-Rhodomonas_salina.5
MQGPPPHSTSAAYYLLRDSLPGLEVQGVERRASEYDGWNEENLSTPSSVHGRQSTQFRCYWSSGKALTQVSQLFAPGYCLATGNGSLCTRVAHSHPSTDICT